jgi:nucleotide-binding universal stress UspA family protein
MYETILVPTDGSDHAERAAAHAQYLSVLFEATVHLISVVDVQAAAGPFDAGGVDDEFTDRIRSDGRDTIDAIEADFENGSAETAVVEGSPGTAILDYAAEHGVDLIAMGTHGRTGLRRYIAGSVTEHVVRHAEVPVLTVRVTDASVLEDGYDDVLIPTDGSEAAGVAVDHALAVAERTGARVHAVNVVDVSDLSSGPDYTLPTELLEQFRDRGERVTEEIAAAAEDRGLDTVTDVREGFPARDLLDYVGEHGIELIAMGTAGRTGMSRFLLGSTAERIIRHAESPVLAINARDG